MNLGIVANYGYRWILIPGLMGIFFGIGHFLTYFFFSKEVFGKFEKKVYGYFDDQSSTNNTIRQRKNDLIA
jgi:hypothetical protein